MNINAKFGFSYQNSNKKYDKFWSMLDSGKWEEETISFLCQYSGSDFVLYDIGAWIGPISLIAASQGSEVYSYEPDPIAYGELSENLLLNKQFNIHLYNVAISKKVGSLKLYSAKGLGDSETSALRKNESDVEFDVPTIPLSSIVDKGAKRKTVKIDIEGFEFELKKEIANFLEDAEAVLLSVHPRNLKIRSLAFRELVELYRLVSKSMGGNFYQALHFYMKALRCVFLKRRMKNFEIFIAKS